jgi:hypothetical protein
MPYIGNQPAEQFTSFATQEFSTSATTSYTLDHAVTNENEIALFINNVRQQPGSGKAYTATGTALTLSAATASTDTMYCVFLGRALQTVTPATNSITAAMVGNDLISGKDALTSAPASTDEFLVSDAGVLKRIDASLVGKGKLLQIQNMSATGSTETSSGTFQDTHLTDTITCSATSSKVLIFTSFNHRVNNSNANAIVTVERDIGGSTATLHSGSLGLAHTYETNYTMTSFFVLDSPNSTAEITYTVQLKSDNASYNASVGRVNGDDQLYLFEIGA